MLGLATAHSIAIPGVRPGAPPFVGPLDDYTADLALALLPFRGFGAFTGAGWRLRDDGDGDAELSVLFDPLTGDPTPPTLAGNGGIKWWYDQSGNSRDLPQASASAQPFWTDNVLAGYPVARLDGTDDEMTNSWAASTATARTFYAVCKKRSPADGLSYQPAAHIGSSNVACIECNSASSWQWFANEAYGTSTLGGGVTNWTLLAVKFSDEATAQGWVNNTAGSSFDPRGEYQANGFSLGGTINDYADVDVGAVLLYDIAHDDTTRQAIQTILAAKLGISLA